MSKKLTKEDLLAARGLIELGWTHGTPIDDDYRDPSSPAPPAYCLGGAIAKVLFGDAYRMYDQDVVDIYEEFTILSNIPVRKYGDYTEDGEAWDYEAGPTDWAGSVYNFNDDTDQETVLAAIDTAVANLD